MLAAPALAAAAEPSRFDGDWDVTLSCPKSPSGAALAYAYEFPAQVKDGVLHGHRGDEGQPGFMRLDGPIRPDGSAALIADGLTNIPMYALHNVRKGTPYRYAVAAQFEGARGDGSWTTLRTCTFAFMKR